jgi:hypothetical protein
MPVTKIAAQALAIFVIASPALGEVPELGLPIACVVGQDCWVQQYADHDPSADVRDYACGKQTYDGHDGTDIRVRDTQTTADVIAAAAGTVKAIRDGVADRLIRSEADRAAVADRECGNGVLIEHADGWETQYCHMRMGSIVVQPGDRVAQGQKLGLVGYSGMVQFPHVHLAVRQGGRNIDPFRNAQEDGQCGKTLDPLWTKDALDSLAYKRGDILDLGLAPGAIKMEDLENGLITPVPADDWPAMVAYVWAINLEQNDIVSIRLEGPDGISADNSVTLDRAKAQYMLFAGRKKPSGGWPKGLYRSRVEISNAGEMRLTKEWETRLR